MSDSWCEVTTLQRINKTLTCSEAKVELYASGWALDTDTTAILNGWDDDITAIVNNVDQGIGYCALYK